MDPTTQPQPAREATARGVTHVATREVVAGLVNDGSATAVATAAVRLARELGGEVRFVHVFPHEISGELRGDAEAATFAAAMRALRGRPRVRATFEAPAGDAGRILVARSHRALVLVVGEDHLPMDRRRPAVAAYCVARAGCRVQVVPDADRTGANGP